MLRRKMDFLVLVFVLVCILQPIVVWGQVAGDQKVKLTQVNSRLEPTDISGEYSGIYEIEWAVFQFDGQGWARVDNSALGDFTFTAQVDHRNTDGWKDLRKNISGFSYKSETLEKFVEPVKFRVLGRRSTGGSNSDIGYEEAHPLVVTTEDSKGSSGMDPSTISLVQWFVAPYLNYMFGMKKIDKDYQGDNGFLVQAKRAIDNSGPIGQAAASFIGFVGNLGFFLFLWGNFLVHREAKWGEVSIEYGKVMENWRRVINQMNARIQCELMGSEDVTQEVASLRIWKKQLSEASVEKLIAAGTQENESSFQKSGKVLLEDLQKEFDALGTDTVNGVKQSKKIKPTARILQAGLKNMVNNGMKWDQASEEVDRAMEARSNQELNFLRRKSVMEFLHFGAGVTPLLGLLGTVTGISQAFLNLGTQSNSGSNLEPSQVIGKLAPAINEALWTTVLGLIASIFLMLGFYLMDSRFDALQSKWDQLFVSVTEDL